MTRNRNNTMDIKNYPAADSGRSDDAGYDRPGQVGPGHDGTGYDGNGDDSFSVIGITGGVGCGKSTVLAYLEKHCGAEIIECDRIGRELQEKGGSCYGPMCRLLSGYDCFGPDGFDRKKLAALLFGDPQLLSKVNEIVHPAVFETVKERIAQAQEKKRLAAVESALLLQCGYERICDEIWYIYTDEPSRRERLKFSRGYSDEHIDRILASQESDVFFREKADRVIDNSSPDMENTYRQIDRALKELSGSTAFPECEYSDKAPACRFSSENEVT